MNSYYLLPIISYLLRTTTYYYYLLPRPLSL